MSVEDRLDIVVLWNIIQPKVELGNTVTQEYKDNSMKPRGSLWLRECRSFTLPRKSRLHPTKGFTPQVKVLPHEGFYPASQGFAPPRVLPRKSRFRPTEGFTPRRVLPRKSRFYPTEDFNLQLARKNMKKFKKFKENPNILDEVF